MYVCIYLHNVSTSIRIPGYETQKKNQAKKSQRKETKKRKTKEKKKKEVFFLHQRTLSLQARPLWTYMSSVLFFDRQGQHIQWRILQFTSHLRFHPVHTPQPLVACTPPCVGEVIQLFFRVCVPTEGVPLFTIPDELLLL